VLFATTFLAIGAEKQGKFQFFSLMEDTFPALLEEGRADASCSDENDPITFLQ